MRRASALRRQTNTESVQKSNVIGHRLRQARLSQQLTLQALAERIKQQAGFEMGQPTLTRIELGKRSVFDFEIIALVNALQIDVRWLLGLPEDSSK
ncbi:helix-turn-helix domain-containing protein [Deinococcus sp. QL22]|uniref:helix-turn-helix domain-containing protein n=1 Tax=Deinococcus sp. QL22 TaxID=2939437 RepID=UPI0020181184|nr:helix-turn-helix transcriptional regulator [Deinococcus sp. QL22]UQN10219.1 helix-turn-helix transcriptional regulator [Deinococcus sp. QL22]